jgi:hypothetical protein
MDAEVSEAATLRRACPFLFVSSRWAAYISVWTDVPTAEDAETHENDSYETADDGMKVEYLQMPAIERSYAGWAGLICQLHPLWKGSVSI